MSRLVKRLKSCDVVSSGLDRYDAQALAASLVHRVNGEAVLVAFVEGDRITFVGGRQGDHSLDFKASSPERVRAHWDGYVENYVGGGK